MNEFNCIVENNLDYKRCIQHLEIDVTTPRKTFKLQLVSHHVLVMYILYTTMSKYLYIAIVAI